MKTTVPYNFKKAILFGALVALPFAFAGCEKENTTPNNNGGNGGTNPGGTQPQKHNVELVYGQNNETQWQNISLDTLYKYNEDRTVDTIFMIPEMTNQFSTLNTNQLKNYLIPLLRERHNVNPDKIFGKGEMQLDADAIRDNNEIVRFFADTLKYKVTYYNHAKSK